MPVARATHMWPHSCRATEIRMASANSAMPMANIISLPGPFSNHSGNLGGARSRERALRPLPCPALRVPYLIHLSGDLAQFGRPLVGGVQHVGDGFDDGRKADPPCEERLRCFFIGRVVDGGHAAAGLTGVPGKLDRGENVGV